MTDEQEATAYARTQAAANRRVQLSRLSNAFLAGIALERERCARIADEWDKVIDPFAARKIAAEIRRGTESKG